ncbi:MAG: hypothetical protein ABI181_07855 [Mycobacteriaceae bacterium]
MTDPVTDPVSVAEEAAEQPAASPSPLLPDDVVDRLVHVIKVAFPHRAVPEGPYRRTAEHIVSLVSGNGYQTALLGQGLVGLDALREQPFADLDPDDALAVLKSVEHTPFFVLVRSSTVTFMYSDPELWAAVGYEGFSSDQGGYVDRGFDDLDWLPAARITEHPSLTGEKA